MVVADDGRRNGNVNRTKCPNIKPPSTRGAWSPTGERMADRLGGISVPTWMGGRLSLILRKSTTVGQVELKSSAWLGSAPESSHLSFEIQNPNWVACSSSTWSGRNVVEVLNWNIRRIQWRIFIYRSSCRWNYCGGVVLEAGFEFTVTPQPVLCGGSCVVCMKRVFPWRERFALSIFHFKLVLGAEFNL